MPRLLLVGVRHRRDTQVRLVPLGQALRIPGATPAAVAVVGAYLRRQPPSHVSESAEQLG